MTKIRFILLDLDGVFYKFPQDSRSVHVTAVGSAIRNFINPALSEEEAVALAAYYNDRDGETHFYIDGAVPTKIRGEVYDHITDQIDYGRLEVHPGLAEEFRRFASEGIGFAILTHSNARACHLVLERGEGLTDVFHDAIRITSCKIDYARKSTGVAAFRKAGEILSFDPEKTVFIDDSERNLVNARKSGIGTIIHISDAPNENLPEYIDHRCPDLRSAIEYIRNLNAQGMSAEPEKLKI